MTNLRAINRVWKVGSRWSHDGNAGSCILDIFRKHHVVFVGHEHGSFRRIQEGDLVVISSGTRVVAIGKAMEDAKPYESSGLILESHEHPRVDPDDIGLACRISYQDLREEDFVDYRIGAFHQVHEKADHYRRLFESYDLARKQDEFSIKAKSCTLLHNAESSADVLLGTESSYHIPIFQRPYSWGEPEVRRFLADLLNSYFGRLGRAQGEPMFLGTMQVAAPKPRDEDGKGKSYDIIDGQQRLTTLTLTMKALQIRKRVNAEVPTSWLTTSVGGTVQQNYLTQALTAEEPRSMENPQNPYLENLNLILGFLDDDADLEAKADDSGLWKYLTSRVYFVIIETRAGLSKTLQIFDAINTAGMDLSGGDVFKIRYYEYLREKENGSESVFEQISEIYTKIDEANREFPDKRIWLENILDCAKWVVSSQLDLSYQAREYRGVTFFDRLFDTVLKVESWEAFSHDKSMRLGLPIQLFEELIEACVTWEHMRENCAPEARAMSVFTDWGRYDSYSYSLAVVLLWRFKPSQTELDEFLIECGKLLFIYSIRFMKKTYDGRKVVHTILNLICRESTNPEEVLAKIRSLREQNAHAVHDRLMHDYLAHNPRCKNLVCRLTAFLDELKSLDMKANDLCKLLFWDQEIDIEHIEAANHKDGTLRSDIATMWGQDLHGLGNLTVLERDINRSISNEPYSSHKRARYRGSRFKSVRAFAESHETWSLDLAQARKKALAEHLQKYLCDFSATQQYTQLA